MLQRKPKRKNPPLNIHTLSSMWTAQRCIKIKTQDAQYVSMEDVWHTLHACVLNSNGTTDPQLDLCADSTHPPTRPSVQLCIGKQLGCMQELLSAHCTQDMWLTGLICRNKPPSCAFFFFFRFTFSLQIDANSSFVLSILTETTWLKWVIKFSHHVLSLVALVWLFVWVLQKSTGVSN